MSDKQVEIYYHPASFYSQKALCVLEEKGLQYKGNLVKIYDGETREPFFLRMNPSGAIPVLKHGALILPDSQAVIHYLEQTFPDSKPMIPSTSDPEYRDRVVHCQKRLDSLPIYMLTYGSFFNRQFVKNSLVSDAAAEDKKNMLVRLKGPEAVNILQKYADENPDLRELYETKIEMAKALPANIPAELVAKEVEKAKEVLQEMEDMLQKQAGSPDNWLCGADYTEADVILAVTLNRFRLVGYAYMWEDGKLPNMERYFNRVQERPSFKKICAQ